MSDPYVGVILPYVCMIGNMAHDMIKSCRTCPLAPCGHKRVGHECRVRVEQHYDPSGRLMPERRRVTSCPK